MLRKCCLLAMCVILWINLLPFQYISIITHYFGKFRIHQFLLIAENMAECFIIVCIIMRKELRHSVEKNVWKINFVKNKKKIIKKNLWNVGKGEEGQRNAKFFLSTSHSNLDESLDQRSICEVKNLFLISWQGHGNW